MPRPIIPLEDIRTRGSKLDNALKKGIYIKSNNYRLRCTCSLTKRIPMHFFKDSWRAALSTAIFIFGQLRKSIKILPHPLQMSDFWLQMNSGKEYRKSHLRRKIAQQRAGKLMSEEALRLIANKADGSSSWIALSHFLIWSWLFGR